MKILVVDDQEYNRLLFKTILGRWNISYAEAENGTQAIEMVKNNHYDLVFMDARMPGLDGLKATQIIREELKISPEDMPVICFSAASLEDDREKYEMAGMNGYLEKPFTEEMLLTTLLTARHSAKETITEDATDGSDSENEVKGEVSDKVDAEAASEVISDYNEEINGKINLENLIHISGGDKQFTRQMLITFLETTTKGLQEMNEASSTGHWGMVAELAHKMMPPCRHIGATDLTGFLSRIEEIIKNNDDISVVDPLLRECMTEFDDIRDVVNGHIAKFN